MSLLWADIPDRSDGIYGTDTSLFLDGVYASFNGSVVDDPDPAIGAAGKVVRLSGSNQRLLRWILPGTRTQVGMGCRTWLDFIPSQTDREPEIHQYRDAGNNPIVSIVISTTGSIQVHAGERSDTLLGESAQNVVTANSWRHIESDVIFDAAVGEVRVWIEGALVLELLNVNTGATPCGQVAWVMEADATNGTTPTHIKEIFVRDGLGTTNTGQMGQVGVYFLRVNEDISSGWTTSSGTDEFDLLDDSPPVDTDFISADDSLPAPSIMGLENLPADIVNVRGLISIARSLKTDSGTGNLQVSLTPNGVDYDLGADNPITTTETYTYDVSELSPDTGLNWTPIEVDSLNIRLDRTL